MNEDDREEQRIFEQEASKHLPKLFKYYEGKQVVKNVDANLYKEEMESRHDASEQPHG